jgi:hypothetical protein
MGVDLRSKFRKLCGALVNKKPSKSSLLIKCLGNLQVNSKSKTSGL